MALDTVQDYVDQARVLLQDEVEPYRYTTASIVQALDMGLMEARRIRPDLFLSVFRGTFPSYAAGATTVPVAVDIQYRMALLYYVCGLVQLRDDEATTDSRSALFLQKFVGQMLTVAS